MKTSIATVTIAGLSPLSRDAAVDALEARHDALAPPAKAAETFIAHMRGDTGKAQP